MIIKNQETITHDNKIAETLLEQLNALSLSLLKHMFALILMQLSQELYMKIKEVKFLF